jgi:hypothetical protein
MPQCQGTVSPASHQFFEGRGGNLRNLWGNLCNLQTDKADKADRAVKAERTDRLTSDAGLVTHAMLSPQSSVLSPQSSVLSPPLPSTFKLPSSPAVILPTCARLLVWDR